MPIGKDPGLNGFTIEFYHHYGKIVQQDVWEVVKDSWTHLEFLLSLSSTFLILIPKDNNMVHPCKFMPICLCNVLYKILTKFIANILKSILSFLISEEQSGYVEGHQILDGILIAHETIHTLKISRKVGMLIKINHSKCFDNIYWGYTERTLLDFSFSPQWVH